MLSSAFESTSVTVIPHPGITLKQPKLNSSE